MAVKFKTQRIEAEWANAYQPLKDFVTMLALFLFLKYKKDLTISELNRTDSEQDEYYKADPNYRIRPWRSVHQDGRGCDIRTRDMSPEIARELYELACKIPYRDGKKSAVLHDIGLGMHLHVQVR